MSGIILADANQPKDVNIGLEKRGYTVPVRKLVTADYIWTVPHGRAGVEVKDFQDLINSHRGGRLDEQLYRLNREFRVPILLAMGLYDTSHQFVDGGGWNTISCDNMFLGRQMRGVFVARACPSYDELPERLDALIHYTQKEQLTGPRHRAYIYERRGMTPKEEVLYSLLASIRGIRGKEQLTTQLAGKYSLSDIFNWGQKEWVAAGFTKNMAEKIVIRVRKERD